MSPDDWTELAAWELNGREIKNVVKNAHLWCQYNKLDITLERLVSAIKATAPFAEKVEGVSGQPEASRKRQRLEAA